jgi:small subunit ribosomal protein S6e
MLAAKKKRLERRKTQAAEYAKVLAARQKERAEKKKLAKTRRRSASMRESKTESKTSVSSK